MNVKDLDTKLALLERLRGSLNDALRDFGPSIGDQRWLRPIRDFRRDIEDELAYLHGDEPSGSITEASRRP